MRDKEFQIETINELKIWLEGRFELLAQGQKTTSEDLNAVRSRLHDISNHVAALVALDVPTKLKLLEKDCKALGDQYSALRTTMRTAYAAIGIAGAAVGGIVTVALELYKVIN